MGLLAFNKLRRAMAKPAESPAKEQNVPEAGKSPEVKPVEVTEKAKAEQKPKTEQKPKGDKEKSEHVAEEKPAVDTEKTDLF